MKGRPMSNTQTNAPKADAPKADAPKANAPKPLALVSPETVTEAAKGLVKAAANAAKAESKLNASLMAEMTTAVRSIGVSLTADQWARQVAPSLKDAFQRSKAGLAASTVDSYLSRFKTAGLAILTRDASLQPVAGETLNAYVGRVAPLLANAKTPEGAPIYDPTKARPGRAAGSKVTPQGGASGAPTSAPAAPSGDGSKGKADASEGGLNVRPKLAAALILTDQNASLAERLARACESFKPELEKWLAAILSDDDAKAANAKAKAPKA